MQKCGCKCFVQKTLQHLINVENTFDSNKIRIKTVFLFAHTNESGRHVRWPFHVYEMSVTKKRKPERTLSTSKVSHVIIHVKTTNLCVNFFYCFESKESNHV